MTDQSFSGALTTWREINLSELQKTLDSQGIEIVDNQKDSFVGRKALADKTRDFKKLPDENKLSAFKGLLKAYQTEIDNLTKRSKTSESAFLNVYKVLAEAVDPYPLLEAAVDQTVKASEVRDLETEICKLRDENAELRKRSNDQSNVEAARRKAEAKTEQLEQKMEEMIQERITQKENEFNATHDEKLRNYEDREQDLRRQLLLTKSQLRDLRMFNESNQAKLLDHSQRQDQEVVEKLAEVDMIVADLERANSRVAALERRNEMLRAEVETMRGDTESSERVKSLNAQVANLETETERISRALDTHKAVTAEMEASLRKKIEEISKDLQRKVAEVNLLKQRLKQYNDYDEIKRELDIMKFVEFAGFEDEPEDDQLLIQDHELGVHLPNPNADKANAQQRKSLEALLASKNKRLLEELTKFRILHGELEASLERAQGQLDSTSTELEKQKTLNEKLENDLLSLNKPNGHVSPSECSDVLAGLEVVQKESSSRSTPIPFASSADNTILPIVTSQRDRFRQRNAELEEELQKQFHAISELRAEMKNLQSDNLKLYEKVRYMQSYREESSGRAVTSQLDPLPVPGESADDMSIYRARYEANINPFEAFRGREATRAIQNLNPIERGVLILTRTILGNRRARTFFIFYALTLHLLIMYTTYELSTSSGSQLQIQPYP
ncbi:CASP C terminal-domain-containing protein [Lentinula lateritia]|uniref:CASP C terminal-domain-containing protein n=1 Tax=Lentinula aff. lateritia TaxID=2804960 RepID=A0ACC1UDD9_9AGAR|nr:CASP C terminal-domain-containing protein [Lentinula aff. lateritia]KAJ3853745.1 CASP C terminal-domain-containing protein [Lentinula lateritia]